MSRTRTTLGLIGWLVACFGAASPGAVFMPGDWYAALKKPSWNPPGWSFGPVWSALYTRMAVAAWLVWKRGGFADQRRPLTLFLAQLALNAAWTPLFFGLHWTGVAFAEIVLLWIAIAGTPAAFTLVTRGPQKFGQSVRTVRWRFTQWSDGTSELYDHDADPEETHDVSRSAEHKTVLVERKERFRTLPAWPQTK